MHALRLDLSVGFCLETLQYPADDDPNLGCVWWRKAEDNTEAPAESRKRNYPLPYHMSSWKYRQLYLRIRGSLKSKKINHNN